MTAHNGTGHRSVDKHAVWLQLAAGRGKAGAAACALPAARGGAAAARTGRHEVAYETSPVVTYEIIFLIWTGCMLTLGRVGAQIYFMRMYDGYVYGAAAEARKKAKHETKKNA